MGDINLLPQWYRAEIKLKRYFKRIMAAEAVIFLSIILIVVILNGMVYRLEADGIWLELSDDKYAASDTIITEIKAISAEIGVLEEISTDIEQNMPLGFILLLAEQLPAEVYLKQLDIDKQSRKITVTGNTCEKNSIPELITLLERHGVKEVKIIYIIKGEVNETAFSLEITQ